MFLNPAENEGFGEWDAVLSLILSKEQSCLPAGTRVCDRDLEQCNR